MFKVNGHCLKPYYENLQFEEVDIIYLADPTYAEVDSNLHLAYEFKPSAS